MAGAAATAVVTVVGAPGSGKTAFCTDVARRLADRFPDGQLYVSLAGLADDPAAVGGALATLLEAGGMPGRDLPTGVEARSALLTALTAGRQALLIVDDALSVRQVAPLIAVRPGCAVLVAARCRLAGPPVTAALELAPLAADAALTLLDDLLPTGRLSREPTAAQQLVKLCEGLPLALRAAANRLAVRPHWSVRRLVLRLAADRTLAELSDREHDVRASVRASYRVLDPAEQRAFRALAASGVGAVTPGEAGRLIGADECSAERVLEALVQMRLADAEPCPPTDDSDFRYRLTPLVARAGVALAGEAGPARRAGAGAVASVHNRVDDRVDPARPVA